MYLSDFLQQKTILTLLLRIVTQCSNIVEKRKYKTIRLKNEKRNHLNAKLYLLI